MDQEKTRRIAVAIRKRLRSNEGEQSESKRQKDLMDGDIDDFLYLLDNFEPDKYKALFKPEAEKADRMNHTTDNIKNQNDLLLTVGPLFDKLERNLFLKIDGLHEELSKKEQRINELEVKVEKLEQASKSNNLIVHGIPQHEGENNKKQILDFAKEQLKMDISPCDISDVYRIGKKDSDNRPMIVKFGNKETRQSVYKTKKILKNAPNKYYINEDLTPKKAQLLKKARLLIRELYIWKIWTNNSTIYYTINQNDESEEPKTILHEEDIDNIKKSVQPRVPPRRNR